MMLPRSLNNTLKALQLEQYIAAIPNIIDKEIGNKHA